MNEYVDLIANATHSMLKKHTWTGQRNVRLGDLNGVIKATNAKYPRSINWRNLEGQDRDQGTAVLPQDFLGILYEENAAYAANPPTITIGKPDGSDILTVKGFAPTLASLSTQSDRSQLEQRMDSGDAKAQDDFPTLAVVATDPPSLSVVLNAYVADVGGTLYEFPSAILDLTAALPSSGDMCIVAVGLQSDYLTPEYATSTPRATTDVALGIADRQEARSGLSTGSTPSRAIAVNGDMTAITNADIRALPSLDLRQMVNTAPPGGTITASGVATLSSGTVTVSTTLVTANSLVFAFPQSTGTLTGYLRESARVPGTSFTITSSGGTDTAVIAWQILEP